MTNSFIHLTNQLPANHVVNSSTFSASWSPNRTIQASSIWFQISVTESNLYHQGKLQMHPLGKTSQSPSFATRRCLAESHPWPVNVTAFTKFGDVRKEKMNVSKKLTTQTNKWVMHRSSMSAKVADALLLCSTEFSMNKTIQKLKGFSVTKSVQCRTKDPQLWPIPNKNQTYILQMPSWWIYISFGSVRIHHKVQWIRVRSNMLRFQDSSKQVRVLDDPFSAAFGALFKV